MVYIFQLAIAVGTKLWKEMSLRTAKPAGRLLRVYALVHGFALVSLTADNLNNKHRPAHSTESKKISLLFSVRLTQPLGVAGLHFWADPCNFHVLSLALSRDSGALEIEFFTLS